MTNDRASKLREVIRGLDPQHVDQIRQAYYKAAEGLQALETLLNEASDYRPGLATERRYVRDATESFDNVRLGQVL